MYTGILITCLIKKSLYGDHELQTSALKKVAHTQPKLEKSSAIKRDIKGRRTDRPTVCKQSYEFMATAPSG